jgi:hypothetical protein
MIRSHTGTPKSYLNLFARKQSPADRKPGLWVYRRGTPPFKSTPYSVGKEKGYFAITKPDGSRDESMENPRGEAAAITGINIRSTRN